MIYARSVLLVLEAARRIFRSSSARLENWFYNFCSCSARLEIFFARLARARKIYARTQHYHKPCSLFQSFLPHRELNLGRWIPKPVPYPFSYCYLLINCFENLDNDSSQRKSEQDFVINNKITGKGNKEQCILILNKFQGTTQLMIAEIESKTVFTLVFGKQTTTWTIKTRIRSLLQRVIIFWLLLAVFLDDNHDSNFLQLMLKAWQLQISLFIYYSSSQQSSHQNGVLCLSSIGVSGYLFFFVNNKT